MDDAGRYAVVRSFDFASDTTITTVSERTTGRSIQTRTPGWPSLTADPLDGLNLPMVWRFRGMSFREVFANPETHGFERVPGTWDSPSRSRLRRIVRRRRVLHATLRGR